MHRATSAVLIPYLLTVVSLAQAQAPPPAPAEANLPAPGTRGNPDNVPFIVRRDPGNNPVRLAKATGHVSNYNEEKVAP